MDNSGISHHSFSFPFPTTAIGFLSVSSYLNLLIICRHHKCLSRKRWEYLNCACVTWALAVVGTTHSPGPDLTSPPKHVCLHNPSLHSCMIISGEVFFPYSTCPPYTVLLLSGKCTSCAFKVVCVYGWGSASFQSRRTNRLRVTVSAADRAVVLQRGAGKSLPSEVRSEHLPVPALTGKPTLKQTFSLFHIIWHTLDLLSIPKLRTAGCPLSAGRRSAKCVH